MAVDYDSRDILENLFDAGAWANVIGKVKDPIAGVGSIYQTIKDAISGGSKKTATGTGTGTTTAAASSGFTNSQLLMIAAGGLLAIALIIRLVRK